MSDGEDVEGVAGLATEAVAPIEQELRRRLTVPVDERDALALETALLKAFINGMSAGAAEATEAQIEQAGMFTSHWGEQPAGTVQHELPRLDPWAERYGER